MPEPSAIRDWDQWYAEIDGRPAGPDADSWIDERLDAAWSGRDTIGGSTTRPSGDATRFLLAAFAIAQSESTRRDVARALAQHGRVGDLAVADALASAYRAARGDASLGPALLAVLAGWAERDPSARPDLLAALVRVTASDSRYLVVRAAKIIGRFEAIGAVTNARARLDEWAGAGDPAVEAEARQQLALLALADALAESDTARLGVRLMDARTAFARAEEAEELRHDARLLGALLDVFLAHLDTSVEGAAYASAVRGRALALKGMLDDPSERPWAGYASAAEQLVEHRVYRVAVGFLRVADDVAAMPDWTNFDAALTELAATWQLMWARGDGDASTAVDAAERVIVLPRVGSFLERAVGRQRLARVAERYEAANGDRDGVVETLRVFTDAAARAEHDPRADAPLTVDRDALVRLAATMPATAAHLAAVVPGADALLRDAGLAVIPDAGGLPAYRVATDYPERFGNDPAVDETVRPLLEAAAGRLGAQFPIARWRRFVDLTVAIVKIARDVRSDLPDFVLRTENGGKGQNAGEGDLQEYVFQVLRREYGRAVAWEPTRVAGGRSDNGVVFDEGAFPIEVKAEFRDVSREHIRDAFLAQPNRYASDRDRVAYLLVLDLRAEHAGAETTLYSLRESFWTDGQPTDAQIAGARPNAVIVGLFPGNQPKPSSTTTYSRRPRPSQGTMAHRPDTPRTGSTDLPEPDG